MKHRITEQKTFPTDDKGYLLQVLADNSTIGICVVQDGKLRRFNHMFQKLLGNSREELINIDSLSFVHPDDKDKVREKIAEMLKGKSSSPYGFRYINKRGETLWATGMVAPIVFEGRQATLGYFMDVTEHKKVQEKYRQLVEDINDGYVVIDDKEVIFANKRFGEIFGYESGEVLGKSIAEFLPPKEIQSAMRHFQTVMSSKKATPEIYETTSLKKDGTPVIVETNSKVIEYDDKPAASVIVRDITGYRQTEEKYRDLVEGMNDGYAVVQDGKIAFVNGRFCTILGYEKEKLVGESIARYLPPDAHRSSMDEHKRIISYEEAPSGQYEATIKKEDGTVTVLEASIGSIKYEGKPAFSFIVRDITDRKQIELALRESEEKYRNLVELANDGVCIIQNGLVKYSNPRQGEMWGGDINEIIGTPFTNYVHPDDLPQVVDHYNQVVAGKEVTPIYEVACVRKDGSKVYIEFNVGIISHLGEPAELVITRDITQRKNMQEQLILADRLASIGQLVAGVTHELNNPLSSIAGLSELLLDKKIPDDIKEYLEIIGSEAMRAVNVTKGLLIFARNKGTEKTMIDINSLIKNVLKLRSYEQRVNNIKVEELFDPDIPNISANDGQMQQVFMNLVVNAEQAMIEAHKQGILKITTEKTGGMVRVSFFDDGPGISPENLKKLFMPFFTTKPVGKGTGLGLSICHSIVDEHGGRIYARSEPGKGAAFILELPIRSDSNESIKDSLLRQIKEK